MKKLIGIIAGVLFLIVIATFAWVSSRQRFNDATPKIVIRDVALTAKPDPYIGSLPPGGSLIDGVAFGPRMTLTCTWFTNFENSRFEQCMATSGNVLPSGDGASIKCLGQICEQLDEQARRVAHWRKPEPPWGTFAVRLIGRVSLHQHEKQYLGDGTSTVVIEKLLDVKPKNVVR